jgi:hypothetical protein
MSTTSIIRALTQLLDDGGFIHLWNVCLHPRNYTALYPRKLVILILAVMRTWNLTALSCNQTVVAYALFTSFNRISSSEYWKICGKGWFVIPVLFWALSIVWSVFNIGLHDVLGVVSSPAFFNRLSLYWQIGYYYLDELLLLNIYNALKSVLPYL